MLREEVVRGRVEPPNFRFSGVRSAARTGRVTAVVDELPYALRQPGVSHGKDR
jgi:hypothetical protein